MISMTHFRHATSIIELDGKRILVDPVFSDKEFYPAIIMTNNNKRNPLVDLTVHYKELLNIDGVIITHNHNDHFDKIAKAELKKEIPILCQMEDLQSFKDLGFNNITGIEKNSCWLGFDCKRIRGYHGGHIFRQKLGYSSAFYLKGKNSNFYITGDTLLTLRIRRSLKYYLPNNIIVYAGGARMKKLGKKTMDNRDIKKISKMYSKSKIIIVHLDSINHCYETRDILKKTLGKSYQNVFIPDDGENFLLNDKFIDI